MKINPRSKSKHYLTGVPVLAVAIVAHYYPPLGAILSQHPEVVTGALGALFLLFKERQLFKFRKTSK